MAQPCGLAVLQTKLVFQKHKVCSSEGGCELRVRSRPLPRAARGGAGRRLPVRVLRGRAARRGSDPQTRRRPLTRRRGADGRARGRRRRGRDLLPDDGLRLLQPGLARGRACARPAARARPSRRAARRLSAPRPRRPVRPRDRVAQPRSGVHALAGRGRDQRDGGALVRSRDLPLGLEPALALGLPARGAAQRGVPLAAAADAPRDLGLPGHADGRDDARDARGGEGAPPRAARRRRIDLS